MLELSPEEAVCVAIRFCFDVRAVVTWSRPDSPFFFIQDSSGGVCVLRGSSISSVRPPAGTWEVRGYTAVRDRLHRWLRPRVLTSSAKWSCQWRGRFHWSRPSLGMEEAQWVEIRGYLRRVYCSREGAWNTLELATSAGVPGEAAPLTQDANSLVGAVVRIHGVCTAITNERRKLTGIKLWVSSVANVQVEEAAFRPIHSICPCTRLAISGTVHYCRLSITGCRSAESSCIIHPAI